MFPQAQLKQGSALRPMMGNGARHPLDPGSLRPRGLAGARATRGASGAFRDSKGSPGFPDPPGTCSEGWIKIRDSHRHHQVPRVVFEGIDLTNASNTGGSWRPLGFPRHI